MPETCTDPVPVPQGLPVAQPHAVSQTQHEAEEYSVAAVDSVPDPALPKKAAGAVVGDFP